MTNIIARRHIFKFYFLLSFVFLFLTGLGIFMFWIFSKEFDPRHLPLKAYLLPVFGLILILLAFYTIIIYFKNAPIITIDSNSIKFNDETFYFKDIEEIILTGKMPFRLLLKFPMEGTALHFKNGKTKFFFDDLYKNSWQLKYFIDQVIINKKEFAEFEITRLKSDVIRFESIEEFKDNQFTSMRGISLWGMIGFFFYLLFFKSKTPTTSLFIFFLTFGTFWFAFHSLMMHYFGLTKEFFIVKNHNFFWKEHIFKLKEIKEIVFESQGKAPNTLRIITKDFRNKIYMAGTLRKRTWLELKDRLEKEGIEVRNESVY